MDALNDAIKSKGISAREVGRVMGKGDNYVARILNRGSVPRCDTMARMLDVCSYGLYAIPYDEAPDSALQITSDKD